MKDTKHKVNILLSGGLDSTACAHFLLAQGFDVSGIYIDYGQPANTREHSAAFAVAQHLDIPLATISFGSTRSRDIGAGEIRGRNAFLVFAALMSSEMNYGSIALGIHAGSNYYDCSESFWKTTKKIVSEYTDGRISILLPFHSWDKQLVVKYCIENSIPFDLTYSCESGLIPCGHCQSCKDREILSACQP